MGSRSWWYVNTWVNPEEKIAAIAAVYKNQTGTPKYLSFYSRTALLRVAQKDQEEGLHSLIQENTCSCGLKLMRSRNTQDLIRSKQHRNHRTLRLEANPRFRGPFAEE